jgi:uncharacterized damage-inducible protein DinB
MKPITCGALALAFLVGAPSPARAQAAPGGLRGDLLAQLDDAATKLVQLAEAMPQDKYGWRPGPGVRSVSEVLMHVAGGNNFIPTFAGVKMPAGTPPRDAEKTITDKAQVVGHLKQSFEHARAAIRDFKDADLDKPATFFGGQKTTCRNVLLVVVTHAHEHLGQLIAYARTNAIAPPWSAAGGQ